MTHFIIQARNKNINKIQSIGPRILSELGWYNDFYTINPNRYEIIAVFKIRCKP